jgi:PTS system mannose-specific IIA component
LGVGILIISHDGIGKAMLDTANHMIDNNPLKVRLLAANRESDPDDLLNKAETLLEEINDGDGILILTDLLGSTPSNIAHRLNKDININIITGLNLSMLVRLFNYPNLELSELTKKAYSGGIDGITISYSDNKK